MRCVILGLACGFVASSLVGKRLRELADEQGHDHDYPRDCTSSTASILLGYNICFARLRPQDARIPSFWIFSGISIFLPCSQIKAASHNMLAASENPTLGLLLRRILFGKEEESDFL